MPQKSAQKLAPFWCPFQLSGQRIIEVLQGNEEDGESGVEQHQVVKVMLQKLHQLRLPIMKQADRGARK